ncbi:CubicO group peptidase (beta-lactamase class C family) [Microbacterium halimionae]|uniref:CubicO group peptidase (Beta-lactamase class C family) n=1 Tax=Microbacterium halimionae TaxID=1526413 RepID=A0A7W3PL21_9MICO|nr:serine hydrolase [Microbacterium halimionae]MBA8815472.1 CubicO group peptidase (beta-lactamase class C family) [Microbacterium halimionae]NII95519.1 CubicO group peptidase (beta-lactamase class C family) [Microbacterium halimionae]
MRSRYRFPLVLLSSLAIVGLVAGCTSEPATVEVVTGGSPDADAVAFPKGASNEEIDAAVDSALEQLPELAQEALDTAGVPGLAIGVVHGGETVYADGFGVKNIETGAPIEAQTVFQLASLSKPISATVVAKAITAGAITWQTPVQSGLDGFAMSDPYVTENATVGDFFSHRSGLATGAGDDLEDIGFDRQYILDHMYLQPLTPFRAQYHYSNYGITIGAEAAASAMGMTWEDTAQTYLYEPLGMDSTSSRYEDFLAQADRADLHAVVDGEFTPIFERDPQEQSPAGGVSSNVEDLGTWMNVVLSEGEFEGDAYIDSSALLAATTGQMVSGHPGTAAGRTGMYGFGFQVGSLPGGRASISHSGAFVLGAGTSFRMIPSLDLGIVVLTNGAPVGAAEAVTSSFLDLVQFGYVTRDWFADYAGALGVYLAPAGDLAGETRPTDAAAPGDYAEYVGTYESDYYGTLSITATDDGSTLMGALGPDGQYEFVLSPWDGDEYSFIPTGENAPEGSLSSAEFVRDGGQATAVTLDFFNSQGLGTWQRVSP